MRAHIATDAGTPTASTLQPLLAQHGEQTLALLRATTNVELLTVDYPTLVADPAGESRRVAEFLGREILPVPEAMPGAVRPELHREKGGPA